MLLGNARRISLLRFYLYENQLFAVRLIKLCLLFQVCTFK